MQNFNTEILNAVVKLLYGFENEEASWMAFLDGRIIPSKRKQQVSYHTRRHRLCKEFEEHGFGAFSQHEQELINMKLALMLMNGNIKKKKIQAIGNAFEHYIYRNATNENFNVLDMFAKISEMLYN